MPKYVSRIPTEYGAVFFNERSGRYWHANRTADIVLETLEGGGDLEGATDLIVERFGVDRETVHRDVRSVLVRMRDSGIVR